MFFTYLLALVGLLVLLSIGAFVVRALLEDPAAAEPDPYQASLDAAGRIQAEAWTAIQRLHDIRVANGSRDVIDGATAPDSEGKS